MRNKKFGMTWYQANDTAAMERKLEQMAEKGWLLEKVTNWGWHYRRGEPCAAKYAVTYFPDASVFDGAPTAGQETYADYCAAAGWEFVSAYGPMQFFRSTRPDPTPIETDEAEKLQAIHKSMLKTMVLSYGLLTVSVLLNLFVRISNLKYNALSFLSSNGSIALFALIVVMLVYLLAFLADYFIWYHRSKRAVERGEACLQPHTKARLWASYLLVIICALAILAWLTDISTPGMAWAWVYCFGGTALLLAVSQGVMALMKKRGAPRESTRTAFIIAVILLSIVYAGSLIPLVDHLREAGLMQERQPAYIYTEESDGMAYEWEVYQDPIPLKMEDLGQTITAEDHSSYYADFSRSLLAKVSAYAQNPRSTQNQDEYLDYEIAEIRWDWLRKLCLENMVSPRKFARGLFTIRYDLVEDPRWGADAVYVRQNSEESTRVVLSYSDRIVTFSASWRLTDDQVAAAVKKLNLT